MLTHGRRSWKNRLLRSTVYGSPPRSARAIWCSTPTTTAAPAARAFRWAHTLARPGTSSTSPARRSPATSTRPGPRQAPTGWTLIPLPPSSAASSVLRGSTRTAVRGQLHFQRRRRPAGCGDRPDAGHLRAEHPRMRASGRQPVFRVHGPRHVALRQLSGCSTPSAWPSRRNGRTNEPFPGPRGGHKICFSFGPKTSVHTINKP